MVFVCVHITLRVCCVDSWQRTSTVFAAGLSHKVTLAGRLTLRLCFRLHGDSWVDGVEELDSPGKNGKKKKKKKKKKKEKQNASGWDGDAYVFL